MTVKPGDKIYVDSSFYISRGSDNFAGGIATVESVEVQKSAGKDCLFVSVKENPGCWYNWEQYLAVMQDELKERFGNRMAHPDPDVDTPWIEPGDLVDGKPYEGDPIW